MFLRDFNDKDLKIFREELSSFLPEEIIDFHVHLSKKDFTLNNVKKENPYFQEELMMDFPYESFKQAVKEVYPGKIYKSLFFGLPFKGIDLLKSNDYISEICIKNSCNGLYLVSQDTREIPEDLIQKNFLGFKPYPEQTKKVDLSGFDISNLDMDVSIYDMLPDLVLDYANKHRMIITLHTPRKGRLNDKRNIAEIKNICKTYPELQLNLAHGARAYVYADIEHSIYDIKGIDNLYVDTANINNREVLKVLIKELGSEKILYGSDLPLALFKGKNVDINNKHYYITNIPTKWSLSSTHLKLDDFTLLTYEVLRSIKSVSKELKLKEKDINSIFHDNAKRLMDKVKI